MTVRATDLSSPPFECVVCGLEFGDRGAAARCCSEIDLDGLALTDGGVDIDQEPSVEELARAEFGRFQSVCQMVSMGGSDGIHGAMMLIATDEGIQTIPYVHPAQDSREMIMWLLGAFLAHIDDSTPDDFHPIEAADHSLAAIKKYEDDDRVGWSLQDGSPETGDTPDRDQDPDLCTDGGGDIESDTDADRLMLHHGNRGRNKIHLEVWNKETGRGAPIYIAHQTDNTQKSVDVTEDLRRAGFGLRRIGRGRNQNQDVSDEPEDHAYPVDECRHLTELARLRFFGKLDGKGPDPNWLDDDPQYHLDQAVENLTVIEGPVPEKDLADALNYILFYIDAIRHQKAVTDGGTVPDHRMTLEARLSNAEKQLAYALERVPTEDTWTSQAVAAILDDVRQLEMVVDGDEVDGPAVDMGVP